MNALDRLEAILCKHRFLVMLLVVVLFYPLFFLGCHIGDITFSTIFGK